MLPRILEPELMDTDLEARDYDAMDHSAVNRVFVADFLAVWDCRSPVLDVGTGTAQIPIELCRRHAVVQVTAIDLAEYMLRVGAVNVRRAGLEERIRLERQDAKRLPYADDSFGAAISNSIVHHIPEPAGALAEAVRVVHAGGLVFIRDLLRPPDDATVRRLVETYAAGCNEHQRKMFDDSLRAALDIGEIRALVADLGFAPDSVQATSDRHWTWCAVKNSYQKAPLL